MAANGKNTYTKGGMKRGKKSAGFGGPCYTTSLNPDAEMQLQKHLNPEVSEKKESKKKK